MLSTAYRLPFKALRYKSGAGQVWAANFRRVVRWKNEYSYLVPVPAFPGTAQALNHVSFGATVVGLEVPDASCGRGGCRLPGPDKGDSASAFSSSS